MNVAILLMAGSGNRLQAGEPKQFLEIQGQPLFAYALSTLYAHPDIGAIILVVHQAFIDKVSAFCASHFDGRKPITLLKGGATRQASVFAALEHLHMHNSEDDIVLIHDAARPLVSTSIITDNLDGAKQLGAVTTALHNRDSLIRVDEDHRLLEVLERTATYQVQTPQTFTLGIIFAAHQKAMNNSQIDSSDDAQLVQALPHSVHIVHGSALNFKVTDPTDLELLQSTLHHVKETEHE